MLPSVGNVLLSFFEYYNHWFVTGGQHTDIDSQVSAKSMHYQEIKR
jgi:hypothetical protein